MRFRFADYGGVMERRKNTKAGFTYVELMVVLVIFAVLITAAFVMVRPLLKTSYIASTNARMEKIAEAITVYVEKNHRLPCPADPSAGGIEPAGTQRGSGINGTETDISCYHVSGAFDAGMIEGIVPYKTLALAEDEARDAWGRWLTYRISPAFAITAQDPAIDPSDIDGAIHESCRTRLWFDEDIAVNVFPEKARFCCPPHNIANYTPATDITVLDDVGGNALWPYLRNNEDENYGDLNTPLDDDENDPLINDDLTESQAIAYVLVSHGKNGYGAFTGVTETSRLAASGPFGDAEDENQDGDNTFIYKDYSEAGTSDYFDDRLLWRTQDQLMGEFARDTCWRP